MPKGLVEVPHIRLFMYLVVSVIQDGMVVYISYIHNEVKKLAPLIKRLISTENITCQSIRRLLDHRAFKHSIAIFAALDHHLP